MSFEHEDFDVMIQRRSYREARHREPELRQIAQAEPAMASLTGQKDWDGFLSLIQARIEEAQMELQNLEQRDLDDPRMENEVLVTSKTRRLVVKSRIATLEEIRDLPKKLLEEGRAAKKQLTETGADAAA